MLAVGCLPRSRQQGYLEPRDISCRLNLPAPPVGRRNGPGTIWLVGRCGATSVRTCLNRCGRLDVAADAAMPEPVPLLPPGPAPVMAPAPPPVMAPTPLPVMAEPAPMEPLPDMEMPMPIEAAPEPMEPLPDMEMPMPMIEELPAAEPGRAAAEAAPNLDQEFALPDGFMWRRKGNRAPPQPVPNRRLSPESLGEIFLEDDPAPPKKKK